MNLLLCIHHSLVWNTILQHGQECLFQILLWNLLRGRRRWWTWRVHGFFHPFEVRNLGAMVCVMSMLTENSVREVCLEVFFLFVPWPLFYCPPGGSGYPDSHCP
jgi:hypothetical protein